MKMLLAILMAAMLAFGYGGQTPPDPAAPPASPESMVTEGGLELTASAGSMVYTTGQRVTVTVRVRNISTSPVSYVKFDGCDNGLRVTLENGPANAWFEPASRIGPDGSPVACTLAIQIAELPPGAEILDEFTWNPAAMGGVPVGPGTYTVQAAFSRGSHWDDLEPVATELRITLEGGQAFISEEAAIKAARADERIADWWAAHTGEAIVKQENGEWLVLTAFTQDDPTGVWERYSEELAQWVLKEAEPAIGARFEAGRWIVEAATKYGAAPREATVTVDGVSGKVLDVVLK